MNENTLPTTAQLRQELRREKKKNEYRRTLFSTVYILLIVAAAAILAAVMLLPVLQITGCSMEPTLETGQIVVCFKNSGFQRGDLVAFYYNNQVLLKRVIGTAGDTIRIDEDGNVSVNGKRLEEKYLTKKSRGQCSIDFPYQVPDGKIFVLGDHRETSIDSRTRSFGSIDKRNVIGKAVLRVWPLKSFGAI